MFQVHVEVWNILFKRLVFMFLDFDPVGSIVNLELFFIGAHRDIKNRKLQNN